MAAGKKSGFNGPTIGDVYPKGSTVKKNPNGTIEIIPPKKSGKKSGSKK